MTLMPRSMQQFADSINELGDVLSEGLNSILPGSGKKVGFFLLVFPLATPETPLTFLSDGASPDETIALLEETTRRLKKERDEARGGGFKQ